MFDIPKDFQYPFELTAAEQQQLKLLQACRIQEKRPELSIEVERLIKQFIFSKELKAALPTMIAEKKKVETKVLLHDLAISLIQQADPELIAKFILLDPSLMETADDERLKEYWKKLNNHYVFVMILFFDGSQQINVYTSHDADIPEKGYTMKLREDLSYARQAIATLCFFKSKYLAEEKEKRAWRQLGITFGSLHAAYREMVESVMLFRSPGAPSVLSERGIEVINSTLSTLVDMIAIHGSSALYLLSYFCGRFGGIFGELRIKNIADALCGAAYAALLLSSQILFLPADKISAENFTFGKPDELARQYFSRSDISEFISDMERDLGRAQVAKLKQENQRRYFEFLPFFIRPQKTREELQRIFPVPKLTPSLGLI